MAEQVIMVVLGPGLVMGINDRCTVINYFLVGTDTVIVVIDTLVADIGISMADTDIPVADIDTSVVDRVISAVVTGEVVTEVVAVIIKKHLI